MKSDVYRFVSEVSTVLPKIAVRFMLKALTSIVCLCLLFDKQQEWNDI